MRGGVCGVVAVVGSDGVEGGDVVVVEVSASPGETRERRGFVRIIVAGRAEDVVEGLSSARAWGGARIGGFGVAGAVGRGRRRLIGPFRHLVFIEKQISEVQRFVWRANSISWRGFGALCGGVKLEAF